MKKSLFIKISISILIISLIIYFAPKISYSISLHKIEKVMIDDLKKRSPHALIIDTKRSAGDKYSFYFYVNYREADIIYSAEYLCQRIDKKWEYNHIKTKILSNAAKLKN